MFYTNTRFLLLFVIAIGIAGCPPITIKPLTNSVKHVSCANPQSGKIDQTVSNPFSGFTFSHQWSNGATTEDIEGVGCIYPAYYSDKVRMWQGNNQAITFTNKFDVLYKVRWSKLDKMNYDINLDKTYKNQTSTAKAYAFSENILPENVAGYISYEVNAVSNSVNDWALIGFNSVGAYTTYPSYPGFIGFAFETLTGTGSVPYMGSAYVFINGWPVTTPAILFKNGDKFSIKYTLQNVIFYKNDTEVYRTSPSLSIGHETKIVQATISSQNIFISNILSTFGCSDKSDSYAELSKTLDAACYTMSNSVKFKYKEKYNDPILNCKIYNWKREVVFTYDISSVNYNGINYYTIPIGNNLPLDQIYTLEVTNNKGEVYKLKFKYNNYLDKMPIRVKNPFFPTSDVIEGATLTFGKDYE